MSDWSLLDSDYSLLSMKFQIMTFIAIVRSKLGDILWGCFPVSAGGCYRHVTHFDKLQTKDMKVITCANSHVQMIIL